MVNEIDSFIGSVKKPDGSGPRGYLAFFNSSGGVGNLFSSNWQDFYF
jgi:hypothetical protein